jgi:hypothetical protein
VKAEGAERKQDQIEQVKIVGRPEMGEVMRKVREFLLPWIDALPNQLSSTPLEIMAAVLKGMTDPSNKRDERSNAQWDKRNELNSIWFPPLAHGTPHLRSELKFISVVY